MLDEVGLIHMNGRLFDPAIARFTQADPIIQEPLNSQNYNRYSYVLNNPLVYTDPSGYSAWTKVRKPLATVAIMVATWYFAGPAAAAAADEAGAVAEAAYGAAAGSAEYSAAYASTQAAFMMAGGFAAGGVSGGNIESAIMGAFQAMASFGIGEVTGTLPGGSGHSAAFGTQAYAFNVMAHAALGCGVSAGAGGSCKSGGLAGAFSAAAGPVVTGLSGDNFAGGLVGRMAAGCVGSMIGKGSCEAGAVTAAFDYIYNAKGGAATPDGSPSPALKGDAYHPDNVANRQMPEYEANPQHADKLLKGKTPEPLDAKSAYQQRAVRVDNSTWIARSEAGTYYRFFDSGRGVVHFSGSLTTNQIQQYGYNSSLPRVDARAT